MRDEELKELIQEVYQSNYRVYGARKVWRELNRQGHAVARCTIERLMREIGIVGAVRGKKVITTLPDPAAARAPDRVDRDFVAPAPNRTWVADFTHVAAWAGVVYVAFVVDTFSRRIVGWSASLSKETQLVLDALDMGLWQRDRDGRPPVPGELVHHSDAGSATRTTTRSWSRRSACSRPKSSSPSGRGRRSRTSSSPPPSGSTGTTTADSTVR
ncbi:transposase InsO family protein [Streptomyces ambofaciens]